MSLLPFSPAAVPPLVAPRLVAPDVAPRLSTLPLLAAASGLLSVPGFSAVPRLALPLGPPAVPGPGLVPMSLDDDAAPLAEPELPAVCADTDAAAVASIAASAIARLFDVMRVLDR